MGEIDTKPIESVQAALSLFGDKNDQRKYKSTGSEVFGKEEWKPMLTELANYKVQLEVKEHAYEQALLKIESYRITIEELNGQLKNCEAERHQFIEERREDRTKIEKLEFSVKEISDLLLDAGNAQLQLVHVVNELDATKDELHNVRTELAELKISSLAQAEVIETDSKLEKAKNEEFLRHECELKEAVLLSQLASTVAERGNHTILSEEDEIRTAATEAVQAQEQLEQLREQLEMMHELENQLVSKTVYIDSSEMELQQVKEIQISSEQAASKVTYDFNQLKSGSEFVEIERLDQANHTKSVDTELGQLQLELKNAKEKIDLLNHEIHTLKVEIQAGKDDMNEISRKETEGQVEIALLKAEVHKGRSKTAAAEAAEARANSVKSGLYLAVQQLAIEADEAKKEAKMLKLETENAEADEETGSFSFVNETKKADQETGSFTFADFQDLEQTETEEPTGQVEVKDNNISCQITISMVEYETLIQKAQIMDQGEFSPPEVASEVHEPETVCELLSLKKELDDAIAEIEELQSVSERAMYRAEQAEQAKTAIEDQLRKWRENKQRRRDAAIAALREDLRPKERNPPRSTLYKYDTMPTPYQPLGKILNMKF